MADRMRVTSLMSDNNSHPGDAQQGGRAAALRFSSPLLRQRRGVPDRHRAVRAVADQAVSVPAEGYAEAAALEIENFLARICIPHPYRLVLTSAGQTFAVRAEGDAIHRVGVPLQGEQLLAGLCIPHLHLIPGRGQALAVRAEGYDLAANLEGEDFLARLGVPQLDLLARSRR